MAAAAGGVHESGGDGSVLQTKVDESFCKRKKETTGHKNGDINNGVYCRAIIRT